MGEDQRTWQQRAIDTWDALLRRLDGPDPRILADWPSYGRYVLNDHGMVRMDLPSNSPTYLPFVQHVGEVIRMLDADPGFHYLINTAVRRLLQR